MVSTPEWLLLLRHVHVGLFCFALLSAGALPSIASDSEAPLLVASAAKVYPTSQPPGMRPVVFARGVVSTRAHFEFGGNFSPNGMEYYFTRREAGEETARILAMRLRDGAWTSPETVSFSGEYFDYEPCLSRNGKELFFGSKRPPSGSGPELETANIWMLKRKRGSWRNPVNLGPLVEGSYAEFVSITNKRELFFGEDSTQRPSNLYRAPRRGNRYPEAVSLPGPINTTDSDAHPLIAPDGSFIIFDSTRPGGLGAGDLYISFRRADGSWTEPENLGATINTPVWEVNAALSHDGRYFLFHHNGDIYWVDAKALGIYRPLVAAHSDYDGDGRSDLAVFDPIKAKWKIRGVYSRRFGKKHAIPVPGDFNGNGKTDLAYFLPSTGFWRVRGQFKIRDFGAPGDIPVPGDYDGDGSTDVAFFRPLTGTWHFAGLTSLQAALESLDPDEGISALVDVEEIAFGRLGDLPVPADYDGDGATEIAVFRPSSRQWLIEGRNPIKYGNSIDTPVPADYDGDGDDDIAVWNPKTGKWSVRGQFNRQHGSWGVIPVPGDYDGDGRADLAFFDPTTGIWNVRNQLEVRYGAAGVRPLVLGR